MTDAIALSAVTPAVLAKRGGESCLIRSGEHCAWWRPGRQGYTTHKPSAGRYTLADAYEFTKHCGPEKIIWLEPQ